MLDVINMTRDTFDLFSDKDRGRFGDNESAPAPRVTGASDLYDVDCVLHHDTKKAVGGAILVSIDGDETKAQWLPHSLIEYVLKPSYVPGVRKNGQVVTLQVVTVTLPKNLAKQRDLL